MPEMPCIRCGDCAEVCPAQLLPQLLLMHARGDRFDRLEDDRLSACTECGRCELVCPSNIPLLEVFRTAKAEHARRGLQRERADAARWRFEARTLRLQRDTEERTRRQAERQADVASPDAVAAALARARARKSPPPGNGA